MKHTPTRLTTSAVLALVLLAAGTLCAADAYWGGGNTDIADGTPLPTTAAGLCGNWDAATKNWAASPDGATYAAWNDGDVAWLGAYNAAAQTFITNLDSVVIGGMACGGPHNLNNHYNVTALHTSPKTLTLSGDPVRFNVVSANGNSGIILRRYITIDGSGHLYKTGSGPLVLHGLNNSFTGAVTVERGVLSCDSDFAGNTWSLNGVTSFNIIQQILHAAGSSMSDSTVVGDGTFYMRANSATDNKLADTAVFTIKRGTFSYEPTASSAETIGQIVLEPHGIIKVDSGTAGGVLTLAHATAGLSRGSSGMGTLCVRVASSSGAPTVNIRIPNGVATDTLLPWIVTDRAQFMQVVSANNNTLTPIASTDITGSSDLSTWDTTYDNTSNVRVGNNSGVTLTSEIDANTTLKTLAFYNSTAATLTNRPGVTLTIDAGAIAFAPGANQTIAGGSLTSGSGYLYLHGNHSAVNASLSISSSIVGTLDLVKAGFPTVHLIGGAANTFSGTTYVNYGNLNLNKTASTIAIPGDLVIRYGGSVNCNAANQIAASAAVTIEDGGLLNGNTQTHNGGLSINGGTYFLNNTLTLNGGLAFNGGWIGAGWDRTLNLNCNVSCAANAIRQARFENYNSAKFLSIALNGGNRTFNIADSSTLPADTPEMVVDANIVPGTPAGGSITKTGTGVLQLTGRNTYTGGTTINGGTLQVSAIIAPAQTGLRAYLSNSRIITFTTPAAKNMAVKQILSGTGIGADRTVQRVLNDYEVLVNGADAAGAPTDVAAAAVARYGNAGVGAIVVNNTGTLQVDAPCSITNPLVTVNVGGTLDLNGTLVGAVVNAGTVKGNGTMTTLTNAAGGVLAPGASVGVMTFSGSVVLQDTSKLELEWNDGVTNDMLVVNGNFTATGTPVINVINLGGSPAANTQIVLKVTGTYTGPASGYQFNLPPSWSAITDNGDLINMGGGNYGIAFLPEPAAGLFVLALGLMVRKRK